MKKKLPREERREERRDDKRKDERRKRDRRSKSTKGKEWQSTELSSNAAKSTAGKENSGKERDKEEGAVAKEPRKRYRRRREEKKSASLKPIDEKSGEQSRTDKKDDSRSTRTSKIVNAPSKEDSSSKATFTVKILTNEKRIEIDSRSTESSSKDKKSAGDKLRNKDRPSIQIYRPSPRSAAQSKDAKKPSQEKSSSSRRV